MNRKKKMKTFNLKKTISLILAVLMLITCVSGCGPMHVVTDEDSPWRVCVLADFAGIDDKSYNQYSYAAAKDYCEELQLPFTYKKPDKDTDMARASIADAAIAEGYNILILVGYCYAGVVAEKSKVYPEVTFIGIDITHEDIISEVEGNKYQNNPEVYHPEDYYNIHNTMLICYREEISGFLAGYTAVGLGYRHLGFLGGISIPAVNRYGYGYLKGIEAAGRDLDVTDELSVRYGYAGTFEATPEITAAMKTWFSKDVDLLFCCGGNVAASAAEAAVKEDGKLIGVDVDQKDSFDEYRPGMCVTSAMKNLRGSIYYALTEIQNGNMEKHAGLEEHLGLVSAVDPELNFAGLPLESTQWNEQFTEEDYQELIYELLDGELNADVTVNQMPDVDYKLQVMNGSIM